MGSYKSSYKITKDWLEGKKRTVKHANIHVDPDGIYSYGTHFPMVLRTADPNVLYVNASKYSASTSIHQTGVSIALTEAGFLSTKQRPPDERGRNWDGFYVWRRS